jgi:hypothetical protein
LRCNENNEVDIGKMNEDLRFCQTRRHAAEFSTEKGRRSLKTRGAELPMELMNDVAIIDDFDRLLTRFSDDTAGKTKRRIAGSAASEVSRVRDSNSVPPLDKDSDHTIFANLTKTENSRKCESYPSADRVAESQVESGTRHRETGFAKKRYWQGQLE